MKNRSNNDLPAFYTQHNVMLADSEKPFLLLLRSMILHIFIFTIALRSVIVSAAKVSALWKIGNIPFKRVMLKLFFRFKSIYRETVKMNRANGIGLPFSRTLLWKNRIFGRSEYRTVGFQ